MMASEYDLRKIIGRAAKSEDSAVFLDEDEIKAIALELDISPEMVDHALREPELTGVMRVLKNTSFADHLGPIMAAGAGALAISYATVAQSYDARILTSLPVALATLFFDLWFATRIGGKNRFRHYNYISAATWIILALSVGDLAGAFGMGIFAGAAAVGGSLLIAMRNRTLMKKLGLYVEKVEDEAAKLDHSASNTAEFRIATRELAFASG